MSEFYFFYGSTSPFSNFYSCTFRLNGYTFSCVEQAMMYGKAMLFGDTEIAEKILATKNPVRHKQLGRQVKPFDHVLWNKHNQDIVYAAALAKFSQNEALTKIMLETNDAILAEASPRDPIWGIGIGSDHEFAKTPEKWPGRNKLGNVLMRVRETLRSTQEISSIC